MLKYVKYLAIVLTFLFISAAGFLYYLLVGSKPILQGDIKLSGLKESVFVNRDKNGLATINAQNRLDLARATGFLHAQERFYQMDLLRRNSAGELSEMFGEAALPHDKKMRNHRFRSRAKRAFENLPEAHKEIVLAYTAGINQGVTALSQVPLEYLLLKFTPRNWSAEDCFLVLYSMYLDLQDEDGIREISLTHMSKSLPTDIYRFLNPAGNKWEAPIDGSEFKVSEMPQSGWRDWAYSSEFILDESPEDVMYGSNNWAVSGERTPYNSAMLANDMHLGISVPNLWYRVKLEWISEGEEKTIIGVSLPGTPNVVVGSNTFFAWGFTNSYGDWGDVIEVESQDEGRSYLTLDGSKDYETFQEVIQVKDAAPVTHVVKETQWGPIIATNNEGAELALRWVAHDIEGANLNLTLLESTYSVDEGLTAATKLGIPAQNMVMTDNQGNIAWTIGGPIPKRIQSQSDFVKQGKREPAGWNAYLHSEEYPKVHNPESGRIWTANSRIMGGDAFKKIGDGGYALGARAQQIRDGMFAKEHFDEQALLDIQLDNRAVFLERWYELLVEQVTPKTKPAIQEKLKVALATWTGKSDKEDLAYLIVRQFRIKTRNLVFQSLIESLSEREPLFNYNSARKRWEGPLWQMITERPLHLLPANYKNWDQLLQVSIEQTLNELDEKFGDWEKASWGEFNKVSIQHPMSPFVPLLGSLTDMPPQPQSGDSFMPRVGGPSFGASQRLVVAPGHEDKGILHMPSSQSGHPLSPYFGKGHEAWLNGTPTPLLPKETQYQLILSPN